MTTNKMLSPEDQQDADNLLSCLKEAQQCEHHFIGLIYDLFLMWIDAGKIDVCDYALAKIVPAECGMVMTIGVLSVLFNCRKKLQNYCDFLDRAKSGFAASYSKVELLEMFKGFDI